MAAFQYAGAFGPEAILDQTGGLATGISVEVYEHGTSTPAQLYQPSVSGGIETLPVALSSANYGTNPVLTDSLGNLVFWAAPGVYDLVFTIQGVQTSRVVVVRPDPADYPGLLPVLRTSVTNLSLPAAGGVVLFGAATEDTLGGYSASTGLYTCADAGLYDMDATLRLTPNGTTNEWSIIPKYTGAQGQNADVGRADDQVLSGSIYTMLRFSAKLRLAVGDTIGVFAQNDTPSATTAVTATYGFFSLVKVAN